MAAKRACGRVFGPLLCRFVVSPCLPFGRDAPPPAPSVPEGVNRLSPSLSAPEREKAPPPAPSVRRGSIASPRPSPRRRGEKRHPLPPPCRRGVAPLPVPLRAGEGKSASPLPPPSGGGIAPPPKMPPSAPEGGYLQPFRVPLPVSLDNTRAAVTKGARRWRRRNP